MKPAPLTKNEHFQTEHLRDDLRGRSLRGGVATLSGQAVKFILQLASTAILARLLTPDDFGLVAMVAAITGFIMLFKDLGLSMATVQRADITHEQVSTLFWVNVAASSAIMVLTAVIAPVISRFYGEPRLTAITLALAVGILLGGLTVQHQALLSRQMRFKALVVIDIASQSAGIAVAAVSAWLGLGYWALVLMQLMTAGSTATGVWLACSWRPGLPARGTGVRELLAFGGNMTGFSVINYFARNLDNMLIGWWWGAGPLGFYSRAYSLLMLPIGQIVAPISSVANPSLSRLQDDPEKFRSYYLKALSIVAYASMPLIVMLGVFSREIFVLILGSQWLESAEIFQILAVAGFWQPVISTVGWLYVSLNRTRRMAQWGFIASPLIMLSFCIGLHWGARGVAVGYAAVMWLLLGLAFRFALKDTPITPGAVFRTLFRPFVLSAILGICLYFLRQALGGMTETCLLTVSCCCAGLLCLMLSRTWKGFRDDMIAVLQLRRSLFATPTE